MRARIVLLAAEGQRNEQIQAALRVSKPVVVKWRRRFASQRLEGLADAPGRGRKRKYDAVVRHRIAATACSTPPDSLGTHWSVRTLARHLGVSATVVQSVLSAESIQPHRFRYWKLLMIRNLNPKCWLWWVCTSSHPRTQWCFRWTRKPRCRRWIEPSPVCR